MKSKLQQSDGELQLIKKRMKDKDAKIERIERDKELSDSMIREELGSKIIDLQRQVDREKATVEYTKEKMQEAMSRAEKSEEMITALKEQMQTLKEEVNRRFLLKEVGQLLDESGEIRFKEEHLTEFVDGLGVQLQMLAEKHGQPVAQQLLNEGLQKKTDEQTDGEEEDEDDDAESDKELAKKVKDSEDDDEDDDEGGVVKGKQLWKERLKQTPRSERPHQHTHQHQQRE